MMDKRLKERLFGALIIISLFVIFLPMLFNEPQSQVESISSAQPVIEPPTAWLEVPEPLQEWASEPVQKTVETSPKWTVQLATFATPENADKLVKQLNQKGYSAYLKSVPNTNKLTWVLVGELEDKDSASRLQSKLSADFKLKGLVVPLEQS